MDAPFIYHEGSIGCKESIMVSMANVINPPLLSTPLLSSVIWTSEIGSWGGVLFGVAIRGLLRKGLWFVDIFRKMHNQMQSPLQGCRRAGLRRASRVSTCQYPNSQTNQTTYPERHYNYCAEVGGCWSVSSVSFPELFFVASQLVIHPLFRWQYRLT